MTEQETFMILAHDKICHAAELFDIDSARLQDLPFTNLGELLEYCFKTRTDQLEKKMTRQQVYAAYQLFLNRDPESEDIIEAGMKSQLFLRIRDICRSEEFIQNNGVELNCYAYLPDPNLFSNVLLYVGDFVSSDDKKFSFSGYLPAGNFTAQGSFLLDDGVASEIVFSIHSNNSTVLSRSITIDRNSQLASIDFSLSEPGDYIFTFEKTSGCGDMLPRIFAIAENSCVAVEKNKVKVKRNFLQVNTLDKEKLPPLQFVIFGATSVCNASCEHCPMNKSYHPAVSKQILSMDLFEKILLQLKKFNLQWIRFGLQNEALSDPYLEQRLSLAKSILPSAYTVINTNSALLSPQHYGAIALADEIWVQASAFTPEVYHKVMSPLSREKSFANIHKIISLSHKTGISVPVSQSNLHEVDKIREYWLAAGAYEVIFDALSNRCGELPNFDELSLVKSPGICRAGIFTGLSIDYDGKVLNCCQDFLRREILGDLSVQTLDEILTSTATKQFLEDLDAGLWGLHNCRYCKYDNYKKVQELCKA